MKTLCACGCGQPTKLYTETDPRIGAVEGKAAHFLKGHNKKMVSSEEIIADVQRVLRETIDRDKWPDGDTRITTYLAFDSNTYSRSTIYHHFGTWINLLKSALPKPSRPYHENIDMHNVPEQQLYTYTSRTCLQCNRTFESWGAANRKCKVCRQSVVHVTDNEVEAYIISLPSFL